MRLTLCATALLLAGTATAQMPIPAFNNTFTASLTRGFWFQAPVGFVITGLQVPNESNQPNQVVEVIDIGQAPPAWPSTATGTQLFYDNATPAGTLIPCNIPIAPGTYVGILGACNPSQGSSTSANSYGSGSFASNVLGSPVTLERFGTQSGIASNGGNQPVWTEIGGSIGRVEVYIQPLQGYAMQTPYGDGCGAQGFDSFYEEFNSGSPHDLTGSIQMINTGSGYLVLQGTATLRGTATATNLNLGDDVDIDMVFANGVMTMPVPGGTTNQLTICSNGFVSAQPGNQTGWTPSAAEILSEPQTAWYNWTDLRPASAAGAGDVYFEETATHAYVIYDAVQTWGGTATNTFEFQFEKATGNVEIVFGTLDTTTNWGTGYSVGGPSSDPGPTDLSDPLSYPIQVFNSEFDTKIDLTADARPVVGTTVNLSVNNLSPTAQLAAVIYGLTQFNPGLSLSSIGMPGCFQYVSQDSVALLFPGGASTASNAFPIPNNNALAGVNVWVQGAMYDPAGGHNPLGALSTNGIEFLIDLL